MRPQAELQIGAKKEYKIFASAARKIDRVNGEEDTKECLLICIPYSEARFRDTRNAQPFV